MKLSDEEKISILAMKFRNEEKIFLDNIIKAGRANGNFTDEELFEFMIKNDIE